ncbi:MAG: hypothetical protein BIFFINMI_02206 [Phycisphaerae bacterium]|nr:hypothetical protein [Phycisphaerae bacterium]
MQLAMTNSQTWILVAGVAVLVFFLLRANRQKLANRRAIGAPADDAADTRSGARAAQQIRDQLDELMVQLEELARESNATIETRSVKLEVLIEQADERIARMEQLLKDAQARPSAGPQADPGPAPVNPEHEKVYNLADAGRTPVQIASQVGRDVGEVELILALREKPNS